LQGDILCIELTTWHISTHVSSCLC